MLSEGRGYFLVDRPITFKFCESRKPYSMICRPPFFLRLLKNDYVYISKASFEKPHTCLGRPHFTGIRGGLSI